jgi:HSP90 family molecular chaperone
MQYLMDYEDKKFQNVSKEGLKLGKDSKLKDLKESFKELTDWWKKALDTEGIDSVKISNRLHNTPCVVVTSKYGWSSNMEKIMQAQTLSDASKQAYMRGKRVLEINPRHPIIKELRDKVAQDNEVNIDGFYYIFASECSRNDHAELLTWCVHTGRGPEADGEAGVPDGADGERVQPPRP